MVIKNSNTNNKGPLQFNTVLEDSQQIRSKLVHHCHTEYTIQEAGKGNTFRNIQNTGK